LGDRDEEILERWGEELDGCKGKILKKLWREREKKVKMVK